MNLQVCYYTVCEGGHIFETSKEISKEFLDNLDYGFDKIIMFDGFTFHSIGGPGWRWDSKNGFTDWCIMDQPAPTPNTSTPIVDLVIKDMAQRKELGTLRYGTPLQAHNGRDALIDAYQEALDLCIYLRQVIEEQK